MTAKSPPARTHVLAVGGFLHPPHLCGWSTLYSRLAERNKEKKNPSMTRFKHSGYVLGSHLCWWFPLRVRNCSRSCNHPLRKLLMCAGAINPNGIPHWEPHCTCGSLCGLRFWKCISGGTAAHSNEWAAKPMQNAACRAASM